MFYAIDLANMTSHVLVVFALEWPIISHAWIGFNLTLLHLALNNKSLLAW